MRQLSDEILFTAGLGLMRDALKLLQRAEPVHGAETEQWNAEVILLANSMANWSQKIGEHGIKLDRIPEPSEAHNDGEGEEAHQEATGADSEGAARSAEREKARTLRRAESRWNIAKALQARKVSEEEAQHVSEAQDAEPSTPKD